MKNIEDLRDHLFATLEALRNPDKPMDLDRAKTVAAVARVVVDSAKVENEFMKLTDSRGSGFIPLPAPENKPNGFVPGTPARPRQVTFK